MGDMGLQVNLKPKLLGKIYSFKLGHHRFAYTKDPGEVEIFQNNPTFQTRLGAIVRYPDGTIADEKDLGAGVCTAVGVLSLAYDAFASNETNGPPAKAKEGLNTLNQLRFHGWGTGGTTASIHDIKLATVAPTKTLASTKATTATSTTVTTNGEGKPVFTSVGRLEAGGNLAINEWAIFTRETLSATTGSPLTAKSATTGTTTGAALTESTEEIKGEVYRILEAEKNSAAEAKAVWGLIRKSTKSIVTVPAWYDQSTGAVKEPEATSAYVLRPVMFDHRVFTSISIESGNVIEFPWELTLEGGH